MDANQEEVYGWMGLNPALLLDPMPTGDNLVMRVVRPGSDQEAVLEEARQLSSGYGSRRRRRGRGGSDTRSSTSEATPDTIEADAEMEALPLPLATPAEVVTVEVPAHRRVIPKAEEEAPEKVPVEASQESGDDQAGEPRRRRRRSSAVV
jgi:ribonuclease E